MLVIFWGCLWGLEESVGSYVDHLLKADTTLTASTLPGLIFPGDDSTRILQIKL